MKTFVANFVARQQIKKKKKKKQIKEYSQFGDKVSIYKVKFKGNTVLAAC